MANMLFHKDAQQYYVAPVVDGQRSTIYLGEDKHNAQTTCRKVMTKIEKYKKSNKKKKETAGERFLKLIDFQEKNTRTSSPKMFYHRHAKQFCVSPSIKGKRRTFYFGHDKAVAEQKYHAFMAQYKKDRESVVRGRGTFSELVEKYLENIKTKVSPSSLQGYRANLRVFCGFTPGIKIYKIDHELLDQFKVYLLNNRIQPVTKKQGVSRATVNHYMTNIKTVMNWGLQYNKISYEDVKVHKIKKEPEKRPLPRFLAEDEVQKILNYKKYLPRCCNKRSLEKTLPQLVEVVKFMLVTGRRVQEVVNLKKKDIDLRNNRYVVTKDKTERTNPVTKVFHFNDVAIELIKHLYEARGDDEYIFCNENGSQLSIRALGQRFKRLLSRLGIKNVKSKELRHSFASHMRMAGEPLENIRDFLGHTSIKTTEIYAHIGESHLKKSINNPKINELIKCKASPPSTAEASIVERTAGGGGSNP